MQGVNLDIGVQILEKSLLLSQTAADLAEKQRQYEAVQGKSPRDYNSNDVLSDKIQNQQILNELTE